METKPRMIEMTHAESLEIGNSDDLASPVVYYDMGKYFVDADELRAWRKLRESQSQSEGDQT
jgi:hypothetical protein